MRISVSAWATTDDDVERSLAAMLRAAARLAPAAGVSPARPGHAGGSTRKENAMPESPTQQLADEHDYVLLVVGAMEAEAARIEKSGAVDVERVARWSTSRATSPTAPTTPRRRTSSSRCSRSGARRPAAPSACC